MKKSILFIAHEIGLNGASKSLLNIIDELQEEYDIHVLVKGTGKLTDELSKRKCSVIVRKYYLDAEKLPHNNFKNSILSFIKSIINSICPINIYSIKISIVSIIFSEFIKYEFYFFIFQI